MRSKIVLVALFAALALLIPVAVVLQSGGLARTPGGGAVHTPMATPPASSTPAPSSAARNADGPPAAAARESAERPAGVPVSEEGLPVFAGEARSFRILDRATGKVFEVPREQYVLGALSSEMPAAFHPEALAAQAVAAHTWALYNAYAQREAPDPALNGADFSADPSAGEGYITAEQAREHYGEQYALYAPKLAQAAAYGASHLLLYDEEPILAAFHSASAGLTERSDNYWQRELPYLVSVGSEGDLLSPYQENEAAFSRSEMKRLLLKAFPEARLDDDDMVNWVVPLSHSDAGYVTLASVGGVEVHGRQVREALDLRSSNFAVAYSGGDFTVTTSGYGHGVGMSQYGADFMARQGESCREILSHYYPGSQLARIVT